MVLAKAEAVELYNMAKKRELILMEAIKTAYCPAFTHLVSLVKSGVIGILKDIDASFTKLVSGDIRELKLETAGGSVTELASYVLLPIVKFLGTEYTDIQFVSYKREGVDMFTRGLIRYGDTSAAFKVGLGVKTEGDLIISGTKGYAYVPAPWWKTEYFELRFEDANQTKKYFYKFDGDGLRYELNEFVKNIALNNSNNQNQFLREPESIGIIAIIEKFLKESHNND
jgi:predicted dehydrogenase